MELLVKVRIAVGALSLLTLFATNPALGQAGSLDPTFGSGGIVITNFGVNENNFQLVDAVPAPNGDIVVAGTVSMAADGVPIATTSFAIYPAALSIRVWKQLWKWR
jgi:hypothetical protein